MEAAIESIGKILISDNAIDNVCNGAPLAIGGIVRLESNIRKGEWIAILSLKGELVAIGKAILSSKEILEKNKGLAVKTDRVLMRKGTYPKSL
jgi:H/ACA ribonucleoprotein complex subunit 4